MWPEGSRFGVCLTFDLDAEEVWRSEDPANAERPVALSQGAFGPRVAVPALLELLERHRVPSTWFVPGRVAEDHAERVRDVVAAGHELACHGYTHLEPAGMTPGHEAMELENARRALDAFGAEVVGYRAPGWACSPSTIGLLERYGFGYDSSFMDDVEPYVHEGTGVVELPVSWVLDDAPHFWFDADSWDKKISTNGEVREIWTDEILGIRDLGGLAVLTCHPQVIGRPGRLRLLDELLGWIASLDGVWLATCRDAAERARA